MTNPKILLPLIRKHLPTLIADDIISVHPMNLTLPKYQIVAESNTPVPSGYLKIDVRKEISDWIEQQPIHMWKLGEPGVMLGFYNRYIITEELFTWITLRWS
jgi:hypothetical protein